MMQSLSLAPHRDKTNQRRKSGKQESRSFPFGWSRVQISARGPVFPSPSRTSPQYLKLDHGRFLPHPFQFISTSHKQAPLSVFMRLQQRHANVQAPESRDKQPRIETRRQLDVLSHSCSNTHSDELRDCSCATLSLTAAPWPLNSPHSSVMLPLHFRLYPTRRDPPPLTQNKNKSKYIYIQSRGWL
jgi:hypothetical protein